MTSERNWRTEVTAQDYFGHQKKQSEVADRRPVIRKASDLVGPGIGVNTVLVDDFNNTLATFNGYYSSEPGAANAPTVSGSFVGYTVSDSTLGGVQCVTELSTGDEYRRTFTRAPTDPDTLWWGNWTRYPRIVPSVMSAFSYTTVSVPSGQLTSLFAPDIMGVGWEKTFSSSYASNGYYIYLLEPGVYSGQLQVYVPSNTPTNLSLTLPFQDSSTTETFGSIPEDGYMRIPLNLINTSLVPTIISIDAYQESGSAQNYTWSDVRLTRLGASL